MHRNLSLQYLFFTKIILLACLFGFFSPRTAADTVCLNVFDGATKSYPVLYKKHYVFVPAHKMDKFVTQQVRANSLFGQLMSTIILNNFIQYLKEPFHPAGFHFSPTSQQIDKMMNTMMHLHKKFKVNLDIPRGGKSPSVGDDSENFRKGILMRVQQAYKSSVRPLGDLTKSVFLFYLENERSEFNRRYLENLPLSEYRKLTFDDLDEEQIFHLIQQPENAHLLKDIKDLGDFLQQQLRSDEVVEIAKEHFEAVVKSPKTDFWRIDRYNKKIALFIKSKWLRRYPNHFLLLGFIIPSIYSDLEI